MNNSEQTNEQTGFTSDEALIETLQHHYGYDEEILDNMRIIDGFSPAVLGVSHDDRLIYSYEKMIDILMTRDGMSVEDAIEYIDYNVIRALPYYKPIVLYNLSPDE